MSRCRLYVDTLGFSGDVGPPMLDEHTKKNARDSIRLSAGPTIFSPFAPADRYRARSAGLSGGLK